MKKGPVENSIGAKLQKLAPLYIDIENESHKHRAPPGSESHVKVELVSPKFEGLTRVERHRLVNDLLQDEFREGLHALTLRLMTPSEWERAKSDGKAFVAPKHKGPPYKP